MENMHKRGERDVLRASRISRWEYALEGRRNTFKFQHLCPPACLAPRWLDFYPLAH